MCDEQLSILGKKYQDWDIDRWDAYSFAKSAVAMIDDMESKEPDWESIESLAKGILLIASKKKTNTL